VGNSNLKDHKQIGQEQELFFTDDIAPGAPFWLPKGMIIFKELEKYMNDNGYDAAILKDTEEGILFSKNVGKSMIEDQYVILDKNKSIDKTMVLLKIKVSKPLRL